MEFLFKCSTCYLMSESSERVKYRARDIIKGIITVIISWYRVEQEKRSSISASDHLLFCLSRKYNKLLQERKVDFLKNEIIGFTIREKKSRKAHRR